MTDWIDVILLEYKKLQIRTKYYENMRQNKYQESPKTNFGEVTDALVK